MSIDRTTVVKGPARIAYDGAVFFSKGDVSVPAQTETDPTPSSKFGELDAVILEPIHRIRFELAGEWESLTVLYPHSAVAIGTSIIGATDKALTIIGSDGERRVYHNAFVEQEPPLFLGVGRGGATVFGEIVFRALRTNATAWTGVNSIVTIDSTTPPADSEFLRAAIKRQPYTVNWGGIWVDVRTREGIRIRTTSELSEVKTDDCGILDLRLSGYNVEADFIPIGDWSQFIQGLLAQQGPLALRGKSLGSISRDLYFEGSGVFVKVRDASLLEANAVFGALTQRQGAARFVSAKESQTVLGGLQVSATAIMAKPDDISGLEHYYTFDESTGNFADGKGSLNLTPQNTPERVLGLLKNAVRFTGTQHADASPGSGFEVGGGSGSWTMTCFFNPDNVADNNRVIAGRYLSTGEQRCWQMAFDDNGGAPRYFKLSISTDGTSGGVISMIVNDPDLPDNCSHFLVWGYDSGTNEIFLRVNNGTEVRASAASIFDSATAKFVVGDLETGSNVAKGVVDNLTHHSKVLSAAEIDTLFNAGQGVDSLKLSGLTKLGAADSPDVFIILGDSIALGRKGDADNLALEYQRVQGLALLASDLDNGNPNPFSYGWDFLRPQKFSVDTQSETPSGGFGLDLSLGHELLAKLYKPAIAKYAIGGTTAADDWSGDATYTAAETWVNARLAELTGETIRGVIVAAGTNDATDSGKAAAVQANLTTLLSDIRSEWGATLPVVLILPQNTPAAHIATVQAGVRAVEALSANNYLVDTDLMSYTDGIHPDPDSLIKIGKVAAGFF